jgi:hypothetical protein
VAEAPAQPEPEPEPAVEEPVEEEPEEDFVVTEEIYKQTFEEIEAFIKRLNTIIRGKDFETWRTYLRDEYSGLYSNREYLREQSNKPLLKKHNIVLNSLEDYFLYVVVPSRSQAKLDEIEFLDSDHIKAISIIRETKGLLYLLVREEEDWKIGVW